MAHYDCSNCGEYGGIAFGMCSSCTPKEFHELNAQRRDLMAEAADQWDAAHAELRERIAKLNAAFDAAREKGIAEIAAAHVNEIDARLHEVQMEHHHSYRYRYERENKS
ncbi:hypothetical protein MAL1_00108 [Bacteriophage DSS3_MAL1]|nr:hypothetical protein MAL1_00108 [Bacteriophage DSS3_MAL1]